MSKDRGVQTSMDRLHTLIKLNEQMRQSMEDSVGKMERIVSMAEVVDVQSRRNL